MTHTSIQQECVYSQCNDRAPLVRRFGCWSPFKRRSLASVAPADGCKSAKHAFHARGTWRECFSGQNGNAIRAILNTSGLICASVTHRVPTMHRVRAASKVMAAGAVLRPHTSRSSVKHLICEAVTCLCILVIMLSDHRLDISLYLMIERYTLHFKNSHALKHEASYLLQGAIGVNDNWLHGL